MKINNFFSHINWLLQTATDMCVASELFVDPNPCGPPVCCRGNGVLYTFGLPAGMAPSISPALTLPLRLRRAWMCALCLGELCVDSGFPVVISLLCERKRSHLQLAFYHGIFFFFFVLLRRYLFFFFVFFCWLLLLIIDVGGKLECKL